eukprot:12113762-Ditylum_brightwellii.AAC.1
MVPPVNGVVIAHFGEITKKPVKTSDWFLCLSFINLNMQCILHPKSTSKSNENMQDFIQTFDHQWQQH